MLPTHTYLQHCAGKYNKMLMMVCMHVTRGAFRVYCEEKQHIINAIMCLYKYCLKGLWEKMQGNSEVQMLVKGFEFRGCK